MPTERPDAPDSVYSGQHAFRRTFLMHLDPEMVETLSRLGDASQNIVLEHASCVHFSEPEPSAAESPTMQRLRAALADLRYSESVLSVVGREHLENQLTTEETELSLFARALTAELSRLCDRLAGRLGLVPSGAGSEQGEAS